MIKVSIIIPIYSADESLENLIKNILKQTLKDIEIICIIHSSNEDSISILNSLSEKYGQIKVFYQNNLSLGEVKNFAIMESSGEYIAFLDVEGCFVDINALEILYDVGYKNDANMVCGNLRILSQDNNLLDDENYSLKRYYYFDKYISISNNRYGTPIAFFKNIYKKSFLIENNIKFEDSNAIYDFVFLSKVLTSLNEIHGAPIDFYACKSNPISSYDKLNSYAEKLNHINQFKKSFDILKKGNLNKVLNEFKFNLIDYLDYSIKINDLEVYELALDVFGKKSKYFTNDIKYKYNLFLTHHLLHKISFKNNEEFFQSAKELIIDLKLFDNELLSEYLLRIVSIILSCDNYGEYCKKYHCYKIKVLNSVNESLYSNKKSLISHIDELKKLNDIFIKNNNIKEEYKNLKNSNQELIMTNKDLSNRIGSLSLENKNLINDKNNIGIELNLFKDKYDNLFKETKVIKQENCHLSNDIMLKDNEIEIWKNKFNDLNNEKNNLIININKLTEKNIKLDNDNQNLINNSKLINEDLIELRYNLDSSISENSKLKTKSYKLTEDNKILRKLIVQLTKEKQEVLSSNSWKVTKPIRNIKNSLYFGD